MDRADSAASVYETLLANIRPLPKQRAVCALVTDRDGVETPFHIANNDGKSSSILDLKHHADIFYCDQIQGVDHLKSTTLSSLFAGEGIDARRSGALVMDTQGSELLVLEGALPLLGGFEYIKTEVADFNPMRAAVSWPTSMPSCAATATVKSGAGNFQNARRAAPIRRDLSARRRCAGCCTARRAGEAAGPACRCSGRARRRLPTGRCQHARLRAVKSRVESASAVSSFLTPSAVSAKPRSCARCARARTTFTCTRSGRVVAEKSAADPDFVERQLREATLESEQAAVPKP
jgi:hypothetical protein